MAITTFSYATQADLKNYFNNFGDFDQKVQIFPSSTSANLHTFQDTGYIELLFVNGDELGAEHGSEPGSNGQWRYVEAENKVEYFDSTYSSTNVSDQVFEGGLDFATFIDQQLVNASLELHSLIDARFDTPIPQVPQDASVTNSATESSTSVTPAYDPIIIKATCYIAAANLIRSRNPMDEQAQAYYDMVTNSQGTGIVDRLNEGKIKLSHEVTETSKKGSIREIFRTGTMYLVDVDGDFEAGHNGYDMIRITCTTLGAYGVAKCKVEYYGNDKLFGSEETGLIVTGGYDAWAGLGGLKVRFQGGAMAVSDIWEIEAISGAVSPTNSVTDNIQVHRA